MRLHQEQRTVLLTTVTVTFIIILRCFTKHEIMGATKRTQWIHMRTSVVHQFVKEFL